MTWLVALNKHDFSLEYFSLIYVFVLIFPWSVLSLKPKPETTAHDKSPQFNSIFCCFIHLQSGLGATNSRD